MTGKPSSLGLAKGFLLVWPKACKLNPSLERSTSGLAKDGPRANNYSRLKKVKEGLQHLQSNREVFIDHLIGEWFQGPEEGISDIDYALLAQAARRQASLFSLGRYVPFFFHYGLNSWVTSLW